MCNNKHRSLSPPPPPPTDTHARKSAHDNKQLLNVVEHDMKN